MIPTLDFEAAARRLEGVVRRTPLSPFSLHAVSEADPSEGCVELRLKLECLQESGAFKARGAWNSVSQLSPQQQTAGVVATSSGNHGRALAWAAGRAGVRATIFMSEDAYPNKVQACRELGARVELLPTREAAEAACDAAVARGATLIHPYDALRTIEGAGTVGLEIAQQWPEVEVLVAPVGGGGLLAGSSLALRRALGERVRIIGVEPAGAATLTRGLEAGQPVTLSRIDTAVQGLCPLSAGRLNVQICAETVDHVFTLDDEAIFRAQRTLVRQGDWAVEPAGAAAFALVMHGGLPAELLRGRTPQDPLRVAAIISGGNPDPAQLAALRAGAAGLP